MEVRNMENKKLEKKEEFNVQKAYGTFCTLSKEDFCHKFNVKENGLTTEEAEMNLKRYGVNEMKQAKPKRWYNYLIASLLTPFNCILLGIIFILFYTDVILTSPPSYANIIVVAILVTVSTLLDFFEEYRSNKAA
jgi:Mg2+-importing ATPase